MSRPSRRAFNRALTQLGAIASATEADGRSIRFRAQSLALDTPFRAAEGAAAALAACGGAADRIAVARGRPSSEVEVRSRHVEASLLSFLYLTFEEPDKGVPARIAPEDRTAAAGFYTSADGRSVYLHPGFPHNTRGLLALLGTGDDRAAVAAKIATLDARTLEDAIADAGLCGAMLRTPDEWDASLEGRLLASAPVVDVVQIGDSDPEPFPVDGRLPLEGIRVLDLTRILAGPTCARTLAAFGADALRVGAPHLPSIERFVVDTGPGKRSCHLDLRDAADRSRLEALIDCADVFSQGYRSGALERLGFGVTEVARRRPGIVYVSINCYGHEGHWRTRPGWEQLAQVVSGMAHVQGEHLGGKGPTLLPAAVSDYTTGYLAAFGALVALDRRARLGGSYWVRVSLTRTATWIRSLGLRSEVDVRPLDAAEIAKLRTHTESAWGRIAYLRPAVTLTNAPVAWRGPPAPLGSHPPSFD